MTSVEDMTVMDNEAIHSTGDLKIQSCTKFACVGHV